jgi:hypothetical protein
MCKRYDAILNTLPLCQQVSATAHSANNSHCVRSGFGGRVVSRGPWSPHSPDPNACNFYLWDMKDKVCINNPDAEEAGRKIFRM